MQFSVIYSVDTPADIDVMDFAPPHVDEWDETEDDRQYEGYWEQGHHRKWCAILSQKQFDQFIDRCNLTAETTETLGSIGAPGFGYGWSPAVSFRSDDGYRDAYVSPMPETRKKNGTERDWRRVRGAMLAMYG